MMRAAKPSFFLCAFSLVEICLALGIFAFTLVTIMALFPVALRSSSESQTINRATGIGTSLLAELRANPFTSAALVTEDSPCEIDLSQESDAYILLDEEGERLRAGTAADYFTGSRGSETYVARLRVRPVSGAQPRMTSITLDVESPAGAPASSRARQSFVTMIRERP